MTTLIRAIIFAAEHHDGQTRKNHTPYLYHPLKIADTLMSAGYDETYQTVGILHDVLEDTDATYEELKDKFGVDIADAVAAITRTEEDEAKYVEKILKNEISTTVKNIDKLDNLNDIVELDKETALKYVKKTKEYYYRRFSSALDAKIITTEFRLENNLSFEDKGMKLKKEIELYPKLNNKLSIEVLDGYDYFYCLNILFRIKDFDSAIKKFCDVDVERLSRYGWKKCKKNLIEDYDDISRISVDEAKKEVDYKIKNNEFIMR